MIEQSHTSGNSLGCGTELTVSGEQNITAYSSSDWAERAFCNKCGTHLFYKLKHNGQHIVSAGFFNDDLVLNFDHQIFIDEKPEYYDFANDTKNMTGAEVFAQHSGE